MANRRVNLSFHATGRVDGRPSPPRKREFPIGLVPPDVALLSPTARRNHAILLLTVPTGATLLALVGALATHLVPSTWVVPAIIGAGCFVLGFCLGRWVYVPYFRVGWWLVLGLVLVQVTPRLAIAWVEVDANFALGAVSIVVGLDAIYHLLSWRERAPPYGKVEGWGRVTQRDPPLAQETYVRTFLAPPDVVAGYYRSAVDAEARRWRADRMRTRLDKLGPDHQRLVGRKRNPPERLVLEVERHDLFHGLWRGSFLLGDGVSAAWTEDHSIVAVEGRTRYTIAVKVWAGGQVRDPKKLIIDVLKGVERRMSEEGRWLGSPTPPGSGPWSVEGEEGGREPLLDAPSARWGDMSAVHRTGPVRLPPPPGGWTPATRRGPLRYGRARGPPEVRRARPPSRPGPRSFGLFSRQRGRSAPTRSVSRAR